MGRAAALRRRLAVGLLLLAAAGAAPAADRFAYAVNSFDSTVSAYWVEPETGRLHALAHYPTEHFPAAAAVDPAGRFLVVAAQTPDTLAVYAIDPRTGGLRPVPGSPFPAGVRAPFDAVFHPGGRFLYVAGRHAGAVAGFILEADGRLRPLPGKPALAGRRLRHLALDPEGRFLLAVSAFDNTVSVFAVDGESGALRPVPGSPFPAGDAPRRAAYRYVEDPGGAGGVPYWVAVGPRGRYVYVANWMSASVSAFRLGEDGRLAALPGSPFAGLLHPYALAVAPSGRFVYTASWKAAELGVYAVDPAGGGLKARPALTRPLDGIAPVQLVFRAGGRRLYAVNYHSGGIQLFQADGESGRLAPRGLFQARMGPRRLVFVPGAPARPVPRRLYGLGPAGLEARRAAGGGETQRPPEPLAVRRLAVHPRGEAVYALDGEGRLHVLDGRLRPRGGPLTLPAPAREVAVGAGGRFVYALLEGGGGLAILPVGPQGLGSPRGLARGAPLRGDRLRMGPQGRYGYALDGEAGRLYTLRFMAGGGPLEDHLSRYGSPLELPGAVDLALGPWGRFAYAVTRQGRLLVLDLHPQSGLPTPRQGVEVAGLGRPVAAAVHPSGRRLFVLDGGGRLLVLPLDPVDGRPGPPVQSLSLAGRPLGLVAGPAGRRVYVVRARGDTLVFAFGEQGRLRPAGVLEGFRLLAATAALR